MQKVGEGMVGAAAIAGTLLLNPVLRPWHHRWGASDSEQNAALPGDEFVKNPKYNITHAITIHASIYEIWPWLVQIGQSKGGFYSYEFLENLCGCHMHNADEIVPKYQEIKVGDVVWLHPKAPPIPVVAVEQFHFLVLGSSTVEAGTWAMVLEKLTESTTRLLVRTRSEVEPKLPIGGPYFFDVAHFIMERKMMLGIKERSERNHCSCDILII